MEYPMRVLLLVFLALPCLGLRAAATEDGFYVIGDKGTAVKTLDGKTIHLTQKFDWKEVRVGEIRSWSNDNERFSLSLQKVGAFTRPFEDVALCVADCCTTFSWNPEFPMLPDNTLPKNDQVLSISTPADLTAAAAGAYAKFFGTSVKLRVHPGYKLAVRFIPGKESFSKIEALLVTLEIKNVGESETTFKIGGQNRGSRDNQFGFTAYGPGLEAVPDTGDSSHMGGFSGNRTLKPGQTFTMEVDVRKWFALKEPGSYQLTGTYQLNFKDPGASFVWNSLWQDYATAGFSLTIK